MSRREDIDNAIWSDPDILALPPEARLVFIWTWTNPRCGMAGLYRVALSQVALETGYDIETVERALQALADARFAFYDNGVLFVRSRVKRMRQKTEQIAKSIRSDVQTIADGHPLKDAWIAENGSAEWLTRHLHGDCRWSVNQVSGDSQGVPALAGKSGSSVEGHTTLKGNGNGTGKGKGLRGRGAGRGNQPQGETVRPARELEFERWSLEHFPTIDVREVMLASRRLADEGIEVTASMVAERLAEYHPELREVA